MCCPPWEDMRSRRLISSSSQQRILFHRREQSAGLIHWGVGGQEPRTALDPLHLPLHSPRKVTFAGNLAHSRMHYGPIDKMLSAAGALPYHVLRSSTILAM